MIHQFISVLLFTLSGVKFKPFTCLGKALNIGDCAELIYKAFLGLPVVKSSGNWMESDDIPERRSSVKAMGFSISMNDIGNDFQTILNYYFTHVHSIRFEYVSLNVETQGVTVYEMNAATFRRFLEKFGTLDYSTKSHNATIRMKHETRAVIKWLEANCKG